MTILTNFHFYPLLDSAGVVVSFPPLTNPELADARTPEKMKSLHNLIASFPKAPINSTLKKYRLARPFL
jgi:hypothetical protein